MSRVRDSRPAPGVRDPAQRGSPMSGNDARFALAARSPGRCAGLHITAASLRVTPTLVASIGSSRSSRRIAGGALRCRSSVVHVADRAGMMCLRAQHTQRCVTRIQAPILRFASHRRRQCEALRADVHAPLAMGVSPVFLSSFHDSKRGRFFSATPRGSESAGLVCTTWSSLERACCIGVVENVSHRRG